jgi:hypothetical protein
MPIDYCRIEGGNFGDDLNRTLWSRIFPDIDRLPADTVVTGIGTILSDKPAAGVRHVVLGSGANGPNIKLDVTQCDVRWVRGPLSAKAVGVSGNLGIGDPAWLYQDLYAPFEMDRSGRTGLIPHWATWKSFDWKTVADNAGLIGIDARSSPLQIVREMRSCSRILTESLHGAIFADAMGIPWAPAIFAHRFHRFKWEDWCATIHRRFDPFVIDRPLVNAVRPFKSIANRVAREMKFDALMRWPALRPVKAALPGDSGRVAEQLAAYCADDFNFFCSNPLLVKLQKEKMLDVCAKFARDYNLRFQPDHLSPQFNPNPGRISRAYFMRHQSGYSLD